MSPSHSEALRAALLVYWNDLWAAQGRPVPVRLGEDLLASWSSPGRHYHTHQHLLETLVLLGRFRALAPNPTEVALALWFHDAIYDAHAVDNESRSARWAQEALDALGLPFEVVDRVVGMVEATDGHRPALSADEALLLDLDLSILGATADRFEEYTRQIQAEYAWEPAPVFAARRKEVLEAFAQRRPLYQTPVLQEAWGALAQQNISKAIARLSQESVG